ncbi:MAG: hypothetical protein ABIR03_00745 [Ginsengibacter sp.]
MSSNSRVSRRVTAVLAIVFFLPSFILFIMWSSIGLRYGNIGELEKMDIYLSYFPGWLQNSTVIHVISLVCCVVAITLAARSFKKHLLWVRVMMLMVVVVALFIILFDIFQMV